MNLDRISAAAVLPELILARRRPGAADDRRLYAASTLTGLVNVLAVLLLVAAGVAGTVSLPAGNAAAVQRRLRRRRLRALPEGADARSARPPPILMSVDYLSTAPSMRRFEYPVLILLATRRHDDADLGQRPDRALSRPRADEPGALCASRPSTATTRKSTEAGLKYFVLGALSSGMLLYGASLVYGFTGRPSASPASRPRPPATARLRPRSFGLVFLLAGLCFKISAVPFHMWTPDVYEGAPTPVTAFFAAAPEGRGAWRCSSRVADRRLPGHRRRSGSRSSSSSPSPRWRSAPSRPSARPTSSA